MKLKIEVLTLTLFVLAVPMSIFMFGQDRNEEKKANAYRFTGPFTHKNLTIFLVHGKEQAKGKSFTTLQEALEQKKVIVHETANVNELSIENVSNEEIYVQSGDIVKGGQQDRLLAVDLIVPPHSGKIPISAFCVEHGRWSRRGEESVAAFGSSTETIATKDLKLAAKGEKSQAAVWENVTVTQDKLSQNVGTTVNAIVSRSSLQLAVENPKVRENVDAYVRKLSSIVEGQTDVIGYVFAINGNLNSGDIYASNALFKKLWPKLLRANAVEAIAELNKDKKVETPKAEQVAKFLDVVDDARQSEKEITSRVTLVTRESKEQIFFETRDEAQKGAWVHRNYIRKD